MHTILRYEFLNTMPAIWRKHTEKDGRTDTVPVKIDFPEKKHEPSDGVVTGLGIILAESASDCVHIHN